MYREINGHRLRFVKRESPGSILAGHLVRIKDKLHINMIMLGGVLSFDHSQDEIELYICGCEPYVTENDTEYIEIVDQARFYDSKVNIHDDK